MSEVTVTLKLNNIEELKRMICGQSAIDLMKLYNEVLAEAEIEVTKGLVPPGETIKLKVPVSRELLSTVMAVQKGEIKFRRGNIIIRETGFP